MAMIVLHRVSLSSATKHRPKSGRAIALVAYLCPLSMSADITRVGVIILTCDSLILGNVTSYSYILLCQKK